jgi:isopenicillin-N N-acyltransferase like protein
MRLRLLVFPVLLLCISLPVAAAEKGTVKTELIQALSDLAQPLSIAPEAGKAWHLNLEGEAFGKKGHIELAWDGHAHHFLRVQVDDLPQASAGFGEKESWLAVPGKEKVFSASHDPVAKASLLEGLDAWSAFTNQVPVLLAATSILPLPDSIKLDKKADGTLTVSDSKDLALEIKRTGSQGGLEILSTSEKFPGHIKASTWAQVPVAEIDSLFTKPSQGTQETVEVDHLRGMLTTLADFAAESVLQQINPDMVPDPLDGIPRVDGLAVVKLKGTPEEMGTQHGTLLKNAVQYNVRRTLHGVGLAATIETGDWFPTELAKAWAAEEKYIPERYIREIDAVSVAAGIPREWGRAANVFPERFHCSGLALRGKATVDGKLYHGRVLDYMTGIGLQRTAVAFVFQPTGRNAWMSMGYAGQCSTVTAMNEKGLAMGEMGGRGEGYHDGMPMTLMMREIMERFETTDEALEWMKATPRTCEYFYVLSDAKTKSMAGIASLAKKLADERGEPDLKIIHPGEFDERLPKPQEDTVLMSADKRYNCLADRVKENYGKVDMNGAWDLMKGGVAMKSNLHTVLFAPETLDFWAAQAGPEGEPAYTQKISKLNLRALLQEEKPTQTSAVK